MMVGGFGAGAAEDDDGSGAGAVDFGCGDGSHIDMYLTPFHTKEKGELPHYHGKSGGVLWRKKVINFLVTLEYQILK